MLSTRTQISESLEYGKSKKCNKQPKWTHNLTPTSKYKNCLVKGCTKLCSHTLPLICGQLPSISTLFCALPLIFSPPLLMFCPLLLHVSPIPPMYSLSHSFPVHIQAVQIICSQLCFFLLDLP